MACVCQATVLLKSKLGIHGNQMNPICIRSHIFCNHCHLNIWPGKVQLSNTLSEQLLHVSCAINLPQVINLFVFLWNLLPWDTLGGV